MNYLYLIDYSGTFVFAISGVSLAYQKNLDLFGGIVIGFVSALGGGTLCDIILNGSPGWLIDSLYIYAVIAGCWFAILFKTLVERLKKTMHFFDSLGIGLFTVVGVQKCLALGLPVESVLILGVVSATFGGVLRDVLCNEVPFLFRKEIYATACIIGGLTYLGLNYLEVARSINTIISIGVVFGTRIYAIKTDLNIPQLGPE